jgi:hypothetical protein
VVKAVFENPKTAPVDDRLKAMLLFLEKMTLSSTELSPEDGAALRRAGISREAAEEAILVGFCFTLIVRLADTFAFEVPPEAALKKMAPKFLGHRYA